MASNKNIVDVSDKLVKIFSTLITNIIPSFEVLRKEYIPYGLKPHTRSICWLAEQVILQNVKKNLHRLEAAEYSDPISDISPWDAKLKLRTILNDEDIFINIKVTDHSKPIRKNDIASVKTLLNFYRHNINSLLFYVVIKLRFNDNKIDFIGPPVVRYYPWIKDFVVNPRNEHIQSIYEVENEVRSTEEFIRLLKTKARAKGLTIS